MNNTAVSFNDNWVRSITKEEFVVYCELHHKGLVRKDAEHYYDSVAPAQKRKRNEPGQDKVEVGGAGR